MGSIEIDNLVKEFDNDGEQIIAVDNVNVSIDDGDFLVLVGPSGCGKTTTLRCVGGLERPSDGDIRLNGESIIGKPAKERDIAMVFQDYALYPHMTARENMSFGLLMSSQMDKAEIDQRVEETAEMMGITELLDKKPGELSGGQQQRVALGRAIVREPEVFLMDEPLSNLDAKLRRQMRTELQDLQQTLDTTAIYVTHDQTEAMTMGDTIAILNKGELQQHGTPMECYHQPNNQFVAGFIGSPSMNFITCTRQGETLVADDFTFTPSKALLDEIPDGTDRVVVGIRPSDVALTSESENAVTQIEVDVTEPLGDVTYVYTNLDGSEFALKISGERMVTAGDRLSIDFPTEKVHLFDVETGNTIRNRKPPEDDEEPVLNY